MSIMTLPGWDRMRHGGLLLDAPRLLVVARLAPPPLARYHIEELRRQAAAQLAGDSDSSAFVAFVLERVCGFAPGTGTWLRGSSLDAEWSRRTPTGETAKPRHLWRGDRGAILPVFLDDEKQVGIGRGRRTASQVVHWLRAGSERFALITNGRQWRLVFAGLDFDAFCEWDADLWFEEGALSPQVEALRTLLSPQAFTPPTEGQVSPLLAAVLDSRKGQAELSAALGERVREAVELLVQAHGEVLRERCAKGDSAEIYRAAVRMVMRLVVVLFAESRDLLPRDNALYHGAYGIGGLLEELEKSAARGGNRLARSFSAWPRLLALFRLVHMGSHHPALPVPAYGGELFAPAASDATDDLTRALHVFETAAFDTKRAVFSDRDVHRLLEKVSRTRMRLRQGRQSTLVTVPVDFSDLSSEYIGILYEGLLDFELRTAPADDPVIFLAVGNQPALQLSRLEGMDDKALAALLEKMKDTSSKGDAESGEEAEGDEDEDTDSVEGESVDNGVLDDTPAGDSETESAGVETDDADDHRHTTRTRAEHWARRAVEAGKLVARPRGTLTPDKSRAHEEMVARKARQLVIRVVLPGEWFLVRWGGTRKGSGTFYTRPGLAVPTVQRTLRPLAYKQPAKADGTHDADAPACDWLPRSPEEILALKTCDPACGSGTFPVASLRYLTDALYASVHHHGRVSAHADRSVVSLLGPRTADTDDVAALGKEMVPCRPDDPSFEPRLKAVLKRHVVERCIYGVDLDPLAVELCRLSLWIETMDRSLPFSFLDHKVKCGNGLVGGWFDQFLHYPVMAWKGREGGDKSHSNGVHFQKGARGKVFNAFLTEKVTPDLRRLLEGRTLFSEDLLGQATAVHADALAALSRLHDLPVQDSAERSRLYREELVGSLAHQSLKAALDLWCACWFWPADELEHAPLPTTLGNPTLSTNTVSVRVAADYRFFHWELEFPDVFRAHGSGFDAMLGNPPWDIAKPNSKEFFSNLDPLYRGLGNPEVRQKELFADTAVERDWLDYCERFVSWSNFVKFASNPFGDPEQATAAGDSFSIVRGGNNAALHAAWRYARSQTRGFIDAAHPFRSQGGSDLNLYKLFVEQMVRLLRPGGGMGVVLPASIYNDSGAGQLRRLLLTQCDLQWLFSFENRAKIFPIDSRFRFCCVIARRGSQTKSVKVAFGRRELSEWAEAEPVVIEVASEDLHLFSPISSALPEIESVRDLVVLRTIFSSGVIIGGPDAANSGLRYASEYHMTAARRAGDYVIAEGVLSDAEQIRPGYWRLQDQDYVAFYTGKMIAQFDYCLQRWMTGHGKQSRWELQDFREKSWVPEFVSPRAKVRHHWMGGTRLVFRDITIATNERTMLAAVIPAWPCGNKLPILAEEGLVPIERQLALCCVLNSFAYDFVVRNRMTGINLNKFILDETPIPDFAITPVELSLIGARLSMGHIVFAGAWLDLLKVCPELGDSPLNSHWAVEPADRLELRAISEAIVAHHYGLDEQQFRWILRDCDHPKDRLSERAFRARLPAKGFWRTGIGSAEHPWRQAWSCDPEFRLTNLALVAFVELDRLKVRLGGDLAAAVAAFAPCGGLGGWQLPDRLRLLDFGLGQDRRAEEAQELRPRLRRESSRGQSGAQTSWSDCIRVAQELREVWGDMKHEVSSRPTVSPCPEGRDGRYPFAVQTKLFGGDE
jgi:hypothetical protein